MISTSLNLIHRWERVSTITFITRFLVGSRQAPDFLSFPFLIFILLPCTAVRRPPKVERTLEKAVDIAELAPDRCTDHIASGSLPHESGKGKHSTGERGSRYLPVVPPVSSLLPTPQS